MEFCHKPVMLSETIEGLRLKENGIYVDCTMGGAGHGYEICKHLGPRGKYIGIDQDEDAIKAGQKRLAAFGNQVSVIRSNYSDFKRVLEELKVTDVDGILLDLGVSSYQLDEAERGFSYRFDAPLDMRMDRRQEMTAKEMVNTYEEQELYGIIHRYGEDRFAKNIAKHIVEARQKKPIETTLELAEIVSGAVPMKFRQAGHPAKRTFQAVRIALNRELEVLENTLKIMIEALEPGGRICVITFHSLEDRIVKNIFRECERPCTCPPSFPVCVCGRVSLGKIVTKKPILPSQEELEENPRSKSAKLRIFEKAAC